MDPSSRTRIEYEHQLYQFSSDAFIDAYKGMLKDTLYDGVGEVIRSLEKKLVPTSVDRQAVENALEEMKNNLNSNYERGTDYALNKWEQRIRECFQIPDNLVLPEDNIVTTVSGIDSEELDKEIEDLKNELKNIAFVYEECKQEEIIAQNIIALQEDTQKIQLHSI